MSTETRNARLLIVDDNPAVIREVIQLLPADFDVVEVFEDGAGLVAAASKQRPDLILLDISLPGDSGLVLASRITEAGCSAKVVFLTVHADRDYLRAAFDVGAWAYVLKARLTSDLVPALRATLEGRRFISPFREPDE